MQIVRPIFTFERTPLLLKFTSYSYETIFILPIGLFNVIH